MKKIILAVMALSMLFTVSCSEESATDFNGTTETNSGDLSKLASRSTEWNGVIAVEVNGVYKIVADEAALIADFESTLKREGNSTKIVDISIVKLVSSNTPGDSGLMLVGSDGVRSSIGVWLTRSASQGGSTELILDSGFTKSTSCTGCAQGCNLDYLNIDGKKVAYCNENGCDYDCTKGESSY